MSQPDNVVFSGSFCAKEPRVARRPGLREMWTTRGESVRDSIKMPPAIWCAVYMGSNNK